MRALFLFIYLFSFFSLSAGKERIHIYDATKAASDKEAILILPGFGSRSHGTKAQADFFFKKGYDVFIPDYIARNSINDCVINLDKFISKYKLRDYKKIHVFSYIVGSWTLNQWLIQNPKNNITSIVYDRSPLQERAPYALVKDFPCIIKILAGNIMKEFSKTPYPPITKQKISVGIMIESKATKLIRKHKKNRTFLRSGKLGSCRFRSGTR